MIKFRISIGIPGHLDAEDEVSNLLQEKGAEEVLKVAIENVVISWIECWMRHPEPSEIKIRIEQE